MIKTKKFTFLFILTAMAFMLNACRSSDIPENTDAQKIPVMPVVRTAYKEESLSMPDDFASCEYIGYAENSRKNIMIYRDFSGNVRLYIPDNDSVTLCEYKKGAEYLYDVSADGEIFQLKIICDYDFGDKFDEEDYLKNAVLSFGFAEYDNTGALISEIPLNDMNEHYDLLNSQACRLAKLENDTYAVDFSSELVKFDSSGNIIEAVKNNNDYSSIGADADGKPISEKYNAVTVYGNTLDNISETINIPEGLNITGSLQRGTDGYRMYMQLNEGFFGLTYDNEFVKIIDFHESDIVGGDIIEICRYSENDFLLYGCTNSGVSYISRLSLRPEDYAENKQTIVISAVENFTEGTNNLFTEFNKKSDNYKIESKVYESYNDFQLDIVSGNSPDIFFYRSSSDMYQYANSGVFADMSDRIKKDDICENVLKAFEYKGGLYGICTGYRVPFIISHKDMLDEEYTDWTYEQMFEAVKNMPEDMFFLTPEFNDRQSILKNFAAFNFEKWVNYDDFSCSFDSESFINLLNFCLDVPLNDNADASVLVDMQSIGSIAETDALLKQSNIKFDDLTLLGYPSDNKKRFISSDNIYSVIANGKNQAGAWEFIDYIMSAEYQNKALSINIGGFPSRKDSAEKVKNAYILNGSDDKKDYRIELAEKISAYINECDTLSRYDGFITYIMAEEFASLENGETSPEACAERIQNRVSIYLSEIS